MIVLSIRVRSDLMKLLIVGFVGSETSRSVYKRQVFFGGGWVVVGHSQKIRMCPALVRVDRLWTPPTKLLVVSL